MQLSLSNSIKAIIKRLFPRYVLRYKAYKKLIADEQSFLFQSGWMHSLDLGRPVSANGAPVPWMNFPVVKLLQERLNRNLTLFEYGSGFSTSFYAGLVREVISVEYNKGWADLVRKTTSENVTLVFEPYDIDGKYCRSILATNRLFDVVVVDGRDRVNCVIQAVESLTNNGVIVLDDSQRIRYQPGIDYLVSRGFRALSIEGLKPTDSGTDRTTIFYRTGNCLGI